MPSSWLVPSSRLLRQGHAGRRVAGTTTDTLAAAPRFRGWIPPGVHRPGTDTALLGEALCRERITDRTEVLDPRDRPPGGAAGRPAAVVVASRPVGAAYGPPRSRDGS
ncbi:hypothetical protein [Streptomyces adustus]